MVEVDPFDADSTPVKRTALGRFRHEGATWGHSPSGRVVFYSGDDARFEYLYKHVPDEAWDPIKRGMGQNLPDNAWGHVLEITEDGDDAAAESLTWEIFLLCGGPEGASAYSTKPGTSGSRPMGNRFSASSLAPGARASTSSNDYRNLFVSVQHPGEGGTVEEPIRTWPHDGSGVARPAVIQVWALNRGETGQS